MSAQTDPHTRLEPTCLDFACFDAIGFWWPL